jgi:hypothetical protein
MVEIIYKYRSNILDLIHEKHEGWLERYTGYDFGSLIRDVFENSDFKKYNFKEFNYILPYRTSTNGKACVFLFYFDWFPHIKFIDLPLIISSTMKYKLNNANANRWMFYNSKVEYISFYSELSEINYAIKNNYWLLV